ncbi:uncharacterized protein LOC141898876 [Tubulanus polymorphus]|uniref:uncharacterized protein LOC141898876 n=1 Tax=Tubulanus polymorphus TaxID=672921 RepID=UPI003DA1F44B
MTSSSAKREVFDVKAELEKQPEKTEHDTSENEENRPQFGIKRRNKDERTKNTAKQLEIMLKKQKEHEVQRHHRISVSSVYIGVGIAVGLIGVGVGLYRLFAT